MICERIHTWTFIMTQASACMRAASSSDTLRQTQRQNRRALSADFGAGLGTRIDDAQHAYDDVRRLPADVAAQNLSQTPQQHDGGVSPSPAETKTNSSGCSASKMNEPIMSKFHHPISRPVWCGCAVIAASLPQTSNVDPAWWADQHTAAMRAHETDACGRAAGDGSLVRCGGTLNPLLRL